MHQPLPSPSPGSPPRPPNLGCAHSHQPSAMLLYRTLCVRLQACPSAPSTSTCPCCWMPPRPPRAPRPSYVTRWPCTTRESHLSLRLRFGVRLGFTSSLAGIVVVPVRTVLCCVCCAVSCAGSLRRAWVTRTSAPSTATPMVAAATTLSGMRASSSSPHRSLEAAVPDALRSSSRPHHVEQHMPATVVGACRASRNAASAV